MIRRALGLMGFAGGLLMVAACGDDPPAVKYPSSESFCTAKAAEECDVVAPACPVPMDTCKTARANACNNAAGAATAQGRAYRPENAQACIDKTTVVYGDRAIDPVKEEAFKEACERVFAGAKKKSERCGNAYDCESPLVCDLQKGFCAEKVTKKDKDPCNNPGDICDKGLFCQAQNGTSFCTPKNALGASCRLPDAPCADDLRCNGTSCVALQEASQPCDTSDECRTHFCNSDRKCQARQYASETGTCKDFGG